MSRLDGPRVPPAAGGRAHQLIILVHGYGSNGDDLIALASYWAPLLPNCAFVAPHGPQPVPGFPAGRQWFPITRLDPVQLAEGVRSAARGVDDFIDAELSRLELTPSACALVGFSQGTMMSLHVGLRRTEPLAAVVGYSGALTAPERLSGEIRTSPPVLLVHGDADEMVPVAAAFDAFAALGASAVRTQLHISQGLSHSIDEAGLVLGGGFLQDAFAGRLSGWTPPSRRPNA